MQPIIREMGSRSILNPSRISGIDYTVNPYIGCVHGCVYCYAQYMRHHQKYPQAWGRFCDVKINAASLFRKQIVRAKPGLISLSTATDPYQAVEKKYKLTHEILRTLIPLPFSVSILTKSDLALRDQNLLLEFPNERCEVGFSLYTSDDRVSQLFEPGAPSVSRRIDALKTLHASGVRTWVFLAPLLPVLTMDSIEMVFNHFMESHKKLYIASFDFLYYHCPGCFKFKKNIYDCLDCK